MPRDTNDPQRNLLETAAARAEAEPFFLAFALAAFQRQHGIDDIALAAMLGCTREVLTQLRLCRCPGGAQPKWTAEEDIAIIAERFGIDPAALRRICQD
jgi:hypothetical protein